MMQQVKFWFLAGWGPVMFLLAILMGIINRSWLVGLLLFIGIVLINRGLYLYVISKRPLDLCYLPLGLILSGSAEYLANGQPGWGWLVLWLATCLVLYLQSMNEYYKNYSALQKSPLAPFKAGCTILLASTVFCLLLICEPWWPQLVASFPLLIAFFRHLLGSVWGWVYLALLLASGWLAARNGIVWYLLAALLTMLVGGVISGPGLVAAGYLLASGPVTAVQYCLLHPWWGGSPGITLLILGITVGLIILPVQVILQAYLINMRQPLPREKYILPAGAFHPAGPLFENKRERIFSVLRPLFMGVFIAFIYIIIWLAVVGLGEMGHSLSFTLLGLQDLTVPHWRPVFQLSYFIPMLVIILLKRTTLLPPVKSEEANILLVRYFKGSDLVYPLLCALFLPAGLNLFMVGLSLAFVPTNPIARWIIITQPRREWHQWLRDNKESFQKELDNIIRKVFDENDQV